jgi:hypothetical protein
MRRQHIARVVLKLDGDDQPGTRLMELLDTLTERSPQGGGPSCELRPANRPDAGSEQELNEFIIVRRTHA